ncbi:NO-inducible flavohemoprotein [Shewanella sp. 1_MG-2023]|uniref:NO-inducible flavohemoprotein n=1 Tax=unclassified Shewanella TaxID=196818 RepID=UPI000C8162F2|nr:MULTISPECIES: NO-inducible flavohemoprotein [unclassified Shewanella]MDO6612063.1 NO-inducible flavohemoprotein [Shewanella sp. 7_MG-2023]MDO6771861.1 NO-inducible flavohemoprotein [Shewanella sp. 2_MG-2023]MDO6794205.1 NO-inducible flavohemoprotein [Shewanella sp. 1_MG-2023]PMG72287.1 nitric oxide dioxygenase [Shewanella sp. 10N.286.51.B7]
MLDQHTKDVVKSTIPLLEAAGPALTTHFYQRMFEHNPELKDVFNLAHQHTGGQPVALFNAVAAYAKNIDNLEALGAAVERIAHKHTGFLIKPEQYAIVGGHLLATLKELGGDAVTEEVLTAWGNAYGFLADIFINREAQLYQQTAAKTGGWEGTRRFVVQAKTPESSVITSFLLAPEDGQPVVEFTPGQYLSVSLDHEQLDFKEIRQYSLSDAPNGSTYRISVKREQGGKVSNLLHEHYQVGDIIDVVAPAGDFVLNTAAETPVVLLSAGVGLTPMKSMLNQLLSQSHTANITWVHACEDGAQHSFKQAIKAKRDVNTNLESYVWYRQPLATDLPAEDFDFEGTVELNNIAESIVPNAQYYFCGPIGFMKAIKQQLLGLNVPESQLHYEVFGPHADL